jgi:hypothetical protein
MSLGISGFLPFVPKTREATMELLDNFLKAFALAFPAIDLTVDRNDRAAWVVIANDKLAVEYLSARGFGLYLPNDEDGFDSGPNEKYTEIDPLIVRLREII